MIGDVKRVFFILQSDIVLLFLCLIESHKLDC